MPTVRNSHLETKLDALADKLDGQATVYAILDERLSNHLTATAKTSERLEEQLGIVNDHLFGIKEILGKQQSSIDEHIRRTDLLEAAVKPLVEQKHQFEGFYKFAKVALKIAALIGVVGAGGLGIKELATLIFKF